MSQKYFMKHAIEKFCESFALIYIFFAITTGELHAGPVEDALLISSIQVLDEKGFQLAIQRGAKVGGQLPLPDTPGMKTTPLKAVLHDGLTFTKDPLAEDKVLRILRTLFAKGVTLEDDPAALFFPIARGYKRIVSLLLDEGANPHARIGSSGYSAAALAIQSEQTDVLALLYSRGARPVAPKDAAQLNLSGAISKRDTARVDRALAEGADINGYDMSGTTALLVFLGVPLSNEIDIEMLKHLLAKNVNTGIPSIGEKFKFPLTELLASASFGNRLFGSDQSGSEALIAIVEIFLRHGASPKSRDWLGVTPLHYATRTGSVNLVKLLIDAGANVNAQDATGKTPADRVSNPEVLKILNAANATK